MKSRREKLSLLRYCTVASMLAVALILLCVPAGVLAQNYDQFDPQLLNTLASSTAPGIPAGTRITPQNWTTYQQYLPIGMRAMLAGKYHWRVGTPDYYIEVGPTIPEPLPAKYRDDTEKHNGQTKLVPYPRTGGYTVSGYVAGMPFPNPEEPNAGYKLMYNYYFGYTPYQMFLPYGTILVDRYFHRTDQNANVIQLRHCAVSDEGVPINQPTCSTGSFLTSYFSVTSPEQSKYTTELVMFPFDPGGPAEIYVFLPSLRRSLRLSSSARCSPVLGTDWTNDDVRAGLSVIPVQFQVDYYGKRKLVTLQHGNHQVRSAIENYTPLGPGFAFPKASLGKWEVRDMYVIDMRPVPSLAASYCYGHRIVYMDADLMEADYSDLYDKSGKLWKVEYNYRTAVPVPPAGIGRDMMVLPSADLLATIYDIQNNHMCFAWPTALPKINSAVPSSYSDAVVFGTPGGLSQVMR
jgi:hypothetical protein